jgi:RTX calcium-binding nonapeptide repeat (4 copies)
MRGKTLFLAVLAALSLFSATAVAGGHRVVQGTKDGDELNAGGGADRVFARSGDDSVDGGTGNDRIRGGNGDDALFGGGGKDRLRGGQDNDYLDGGDGDDYLNGGGDGRDKDKIVCGDGYDVAVLGRGDVVLAEADDGCEKVQRPRGEPTPCVSTYRNCDDPQPCAARVAPGCYPTEGPCTATYDGCEDPFAEEPEPDEPVDMPAPEEL